MTALTVSVKKLGTFRALPSPSTPLITSASGTTPSRLGPTASRTSSGRKNSSGRKVPSAMSWSGSWPPTAGTPETGPVSRDSPDTIMLGAVRPPDRSLCRPKSIRNGWPAGVSRLRKTCPALALRTGPPTVSKPDRAYRFA